MDVEESSSPPDHQTTRPLGTIKKRTRDHIRHEAFMDAIAGKCADSPTEFHLNPRGDQYLNDLYANLNAEFAPHPDGCRNCKQFLRWCSCTEVQPFDWGPNYPTRQVLNPHPVCKKCWQIKATLFNVTQLNPNSRCKC